MIDPRREAVLIRNQKTGAFEDRTREIRRYQHRADGKVDIEFTSSRTYPYGRSRVRALGDPQRTTIAEDTNVVVQGAVWTNAVEVATFSGPEGRWSHVFYRKQVGEDYRTYPADQVRVLDCALPSGTAAEVRSYWDAIVSDLPAKDPLTWSYARLEFIHPESALRSYLTGAPPRSRELDTAPIYPFRCNLSQRAAVENGLQHDVSVIEGPPGTGKTETILNLIANIVRQNGTVGVVSHTNAAVDNVRDKLREMDFGHLVANLGARERKDAFFAEQEARNEQVARLTANAPPDPDLDQLTTLDSQLREWQETERRRAQRRNEVDAYRLELRHFEQHLQRDEVPELAGLPLLRRSSERVLDYLAESDLERGGARPGLLRRIRKYLKYGSLRGLDPEDTKTVLRLQRAYYDKRIAELDAEIERCDQKLLRADFDRLAEQHRNLSIQLLRAKLAERYRDLPRTTYQQDDYKRGRTFKQFIRDYPVLLSTCHSLRSSLETGFLLDYLIIDEASQVDPLVAGLAMASCRNLVVVGDNQQLPPIAPESAAKHVAPSRAYDCHNSVLASLREVHGDDALPHALLREHYRCDPAIIGFCNKKFYDEQLIPHRRDDGARSMVVVRTVEGNHMRQHTGGGRSNQREVDVIESEVIPQHRAGVADEDIGVTTPYRRQVGKADDALDRIDVRTVHQFQGRQKKMVVLTTVLDETWRGRTGLAFVDDPRLINVAVSRAIQRFVLVTNHDTMPSSRHIRDLVGHIRYHDPDEGIVDSSVVSIFDLLYRDFSRRLRSLDRRLTNRSRHRSENIAWTALHDILDEQSYAHLTAAAQVLLSNLLPKRTELTSRQQDFVGNRASVDFVVYNRVTNRPLLAIEVDGFKYHEDDPKQLDRDAVKDEILRAHDMPLLRLPTTGSGEQQRIREALDAAEGVH